MYPIESIPDPDKLFCRVHMNNIREGVLLPGAFKEQGEGSDKGLSTDWERYSTPEILQKRAKAPEKNGIIRFVTIDLRLQNLNVIHAPLYYSEMETRSLIDNQSHSNVKGIDEVKSRLVKMEIYEWEILPPVPIIPNNRSSNLG